MNPKKNFILITAFSLLSVTLSCMQETHPYKRHLSKKIAECAKAWTPFCHTDNPSYTQIKAVILPLLHINTNPLIKKNIDYEKINLNKIIENQEENPNTKSIHMSIQKLLQLLTHGYDVNYSKRRPLAIEFAAAKKLDLLCTYLLSCGSKLPQLPNSLFFKESCEKLLLQCQENSPINIIKKTLVSLRHFKILPNFTDDKGNTCLHYATINKNNEIVLMLLKVGASTEIRNNKGQAPIHIAIKKKDYSSVISILTNNAYIEARDGNNKTPLQLAIEMNNTEIVDVLICLEANYTSGADYAQKSGKPEMVKFFNLLEKSPVMDVDK